MNTITDTNKNFDILSSVNSGDHEPSELSSLFTINLQIDDEPYKKKISNEEFTIDDNNKKIIDYLYKLIPDIEDKKFLASNINNIENQIKNDTELNSVEKKKALIYLKFFMIEENFIKIGKISNIKTQKHLSNNAKLLLNNKELLTKNLSKNIKSHVKNEKKTTNLQLKIKKNSNKQKIDNSKISVSSDENFFVGRIKKNDHPNKIYKLTNVNKKSLENLNKKVKNSEIIENKIIHNKQSNIPYENKKLSKLTDIKNNNQNFNVHNSTLNNNFSNINQQNGDLSNSNNFSNSVLENFLDNLDLTQKGWTSKLSSRIERAFLNGGEEIEFKLKPRNLGVLKVSVMLKDGLGTVRIFTENSFVSNVLNQSENYLQKLFNDQGINLEFSAQNENNNFGFNNPKKGAKRENETPILRTENENIDEIKREYESSRHIINVIA